MIEVDILNANDLEVNFGDESPIVVDDTITLTAETDHRGLSHRDAENQHPISAISNLSTALESLETDAMTNIEIENLLINTGD